MGAIVPPMNPPDDTNPELGKLVLEVVENQIRDNDPPKATPPTKRRLVSTAVAAQERGRWAE